MSEELEGKIEELKEIIEELGDDLAEANQCIEDLQMENGELTGKISEYEELKASKEGISEKAFYSGYDSGEKNEPKLKSWLTYQAGERM